MFFLPKPELEQGRYLLEHSDGFIEEFHEVRKFLFNGVIFALAFLDREEKRFIFCKILDQKEIEDISLDNFFMVYDCTNDPLTDDTLGRAVRIFFRDEDLSAKRDERQQKLTQAICDYLLNI